MAKLSIIILPACGSATVFPDVLVPVVGQPKIPSDLIGTTLHVPSRRELEDHLGLLGGNPSFTKHMEVFRGPEAMSHVTQQLRSEIGLATSTDGLFRCAQDPSCLQVWTTALAFTGKTIRITEILASWSMSETGVGNVCHVNAGRDVAYCHVPSDVYKSGLSWLAMGVPVDAPLQEPLPVGVRCHDMGPNSQDAPCHLVSGNEFMAAQIENIDRHFQSAKSEIPATSASTEVVSLGWSGNARMRGQLTSGGMCLDVGGDTSVNGATVQMWSCLGNDNQKWESRLLNLLSRSPDELIFYGNGRPTHCLDVPGGNLMEGQAVWIWECDDSQIMQQWDWKEGPLGRLNLKGHPQWCLERSDSEGGYPFMALCSDSETQVWTDKEVPSTESSLVV